MTPELWQRIDQLYHEALKHKTGERLAFLRETCGDAEGLYQEVESLLEAHDRGGNFLSADALEESELPGPRPFSCSGRSSRAAHFGRAKIAPTRH